MMLWNQDPFAFVPQLTSFFHRSDDDFFHNKFLSSPNFELNLDDEFEICRKQRKDKLKSYNNSKRKSKKRKTIFEEDELLFYPKRQKNRKVTFLEKENGKQVGKRRKVRTPSQKEQLHNRSSSLRELYDIDSRCNPSMIEKIDNIPSNAHEHSFINSSSNLCNTDFNSKDSSSYVDAINIDAEPSKEAYNAKYDNYYPELSDIENKCEYIFQNLKNTFMNTSVLSSESLKILSTLETIFNEVKKTSIPNPVKSLKELRVPEELLMQNLLLLDGIEANDDTRSTKKLLIGYILKLFEFLDSIKEYLQV